MSAVQAQCQASATAYRHAVGGAIGRAHVAPHAIHWAAILIGVAVAHRATHVCLWPCS